MILLNLSASLSDTSCKNKKVKHIFLKWVENGVNGWIHFS